MKLEMNNTELSSSIKIVGRTYQNEDGLRISWTYAGFQLNAQFTGLLTAVITSDGKGNWLTDPRQAELPSYLRLVVDGDYENNTRIEIRRDTDNYILAAGDGKPHRIEVYKVTEAVFSSFLFRSVSLDGTLLPPPSPAQYQIEFIGDSITCGAGVLNRDTTSFYHVCSDSFYAFSTRAARSIGAEASLFAVSGWGVAYGGERTDTLIPPVYGETDPLNGIHTPWDFAAHPKNAVVIGLGTNDYKMAENRAGFRSETKKFLRDVREKNPDAQILWIYGCMNDLFTEEIRDVIRSMKDPRIAFLLLPQNTDGGWGHPDFDAHILYGKLVREKLSEMEK